MKFICYPKCTTCQKAKKWLDTNGIAYARLCFDIGKIPHKYVPYLGLLGSVLGRVDTAEHTYDDLAIDIRMNLGGLSFWPYTVRKFCTLDDYRPMFAVHTKALSENVPFAWKTAAEIALTSKFTDYQRLYNILVELKSDRQRGIIFSVLQKGKMISALTKAQIPGFTRRFRIIQISGGRIFR